MVETRKDQRGREGRRERRRREYRRRFSQMTIIARLLPDIHLWSNRGEILGMPTPPTHYLALARSYEQVKYWCFLNRVRERSIRAVMNMEDARGLGHFSLIIFSGWIDTATDEKMRVGDYLIHRAGDMYFTDMHEPRTSGRGIIVYWERKERNGETDRRRDLGQSGIAGGGEGPFFGSRG